MTVAAVVLAAGGGARWNGAGHKLLAEVAGRPLAAHALVAASEAGLDELVVVTGSVDLSAVLPIGATVLHNDRWIDGQATSLRLAVDYAWPTCRGCPLRPGGQWPTARPRWRWPPSTACDGRRPGSPACCGRSCQRPETREGGYCYPSSPRMWWK